jgi:hypothetical protein
VSRVKNSYISSFKPALIRRLKLIHVAAFIALFILIFGGMEYVNRTYSVVKNQNYKILTNFFKQEKDTQILLLGDSHLEYGVNADLFKEKAYNLSLGGANFIQSYYLLKAVINDMPNLKLVVLPLDHNSFHPYKTDRFEIFFLNRYFDYYELMRIKGPKILVKKFSFFTILDDTLGRKSLVEKVIWFVMGNESFRFRRASGPGASKYDELDKDLMLYFDKILILCKEHHVAVVTISMPLRRETIDRFEERLYKIEYIRKAVFHDSIYGSYIYEDLDYLFWNPDKKEIYLDGYHLNETGKDVFSRVLSKKFFELMQGLPKD